MNGRALPGRGPRAASWEDHAPLSRLRGDEVPWPVALLCKSALGRWGPAQHGSCPSPAVPPSKAAAWAWSPWVPKPGPSMPSASFGGALGLRCPAFSSLRRWRLCPSHRL